MHHITANVHRMEMIAIGTRVWTVVLSKYNRKHAAAKVTMLG
jgi:hypothetical protein